MVNRLLNYSGCVHMQVQFLREKFPSLDIEVDGGVSLATIDTAAQVGCT